MVNWPSIYDLPQAAYRMHRALISLHIYKVQGSEGRELLNHCPGPTQLSCTRSAYMHTDDLHIACTYVYSDPCHVNASAPEYEYVEYVVGVHACNLAVPAFPYNNNIIIATCLIQIIISKMPEYAPSLVLFCWSPSQDSCMRIWVDLTKCTLSQIKAIATNLIFCFSDFPGLFLADLKKKNFLIKMSGITT